MTYPMSGALPQYAKYVGEFVPSDDNVQYFYRVIAYDRNSLPLTNEDDSTVPTAYGPVVLDGNHAISVNWTTVIGAAFYMVFKEAGAAPDEDIANPWWIATGSETEILDVGYPCGTRNSFLNPGLSPIYPAACCGDASSVPTNVPPAGMAPPADAFPAGGYVRIASAVATFVLNPTVPGGCPGDVQFNDNGRFGGDPNLFWDNVNKRLGIHNQNPQQALDVDGTL